MSDPDENPYQVTETNGQFEIRDDSERCVVSFADNGSAEGLAVLLNQVYRKGYKVGFRAGKLSGRG
jgi:hypothetical protein